MFLLRFLWRYKIGATVGGLYILFSFFLYQFCPYVLIRGESFNLCSPVFTYVGELAVAFAISVALLISIVLGLGLESFQGFLVSIILLISISIVFLFGGAMLERLIRKLI